MQNNNALHEDADQSQTTNSLTIKYHNIFCIKYNTDYTESALNWYKLIDIACIKK